jgi:glyoxylase-like metal-dependent hydrolase (beta-lactamase superfamily II)
MVKCMPVPVFKRPALICFFAVLAFVAGRGQNTTVRELAPGVYFWQGDQPRKVPANCTWIVLKDYVVVVDANFPPAAKEILAEIRKTTGKPIRFLFDTHWHGDHTAGNGVYLEAGATIVCSQACAEELRAPRPGGKPPFNAPASLTFDGRMAFDDGERRIELTRLGPAHSKGDAVAYLPKEKILIAGDLCVNWNYGNMVADANADHDNWIRALDTLSQWDVRTVVTGHGSLGTTETLRAQRAYLADMLQQVRAGLKAGKTADQLAAEIDLTKHGSFGASAPHNATSIRAIYRKLAPAR